MKIIIIFAISMLSSSVYAENITLPEISQDLRDTIKNNIETLDSARKKGLEAEKPIINNNLLNNIQNLQIDIQKRSNLEKDNVQKLLKQTIHNKEWKTKQQQFLNKVVTHDDDVSHVSGSRIYFFISSSMPKDVLRKYIKELSKYPEARVLLQGFIGGAQKITPTISYIKSLITKDIDCLTYNCPNYKISISIDPVLFNRYAVTRVPTMVHVDDINGANYCSEGNITLVHVSGVKKFIGSAPIKYMFRELGVIDG